MISEFFKNQTLFITGGTGFVGKVVIEKLLRECEDIGKIYVLIRSKKGRTPLQRFEEIFTLPCFERLDKKSLEKVSLIMGDLHQPHLGISSQDLKILQLETTIVIHAAANVKFTQSLKEACEQIKATENIFKIAENMSKLKSFVYVSTAYSNCIESTIEEKIYKPAMKPENLINIVDNLDEKLLEKVAPVLLGKWPNTYVFMKNLTESMVEKVSQKLPISIVRPAIIGPSAEEPIPGWVDNLYGVVGVTALLGLGVLRSFLLDRNNTLQLVPVDYVGNCVLAAVWKTAQNDDTKIYNYVRHQENLPTWGEYCDMARAEGFKVATTKMVWYPSYLLTKNQTLHKIITFFFQKLLSYVIDFVLFCFGRPTLAVKNYKRLDEALEKVSYFSLREWEFHDDNVTTLWKEMDENDRRIFKFKEENFDWIEYLEKAILRGREFLLKDPLETLSQGKRKLKILTVVHYTLIFLFWYFFYKFMIMLINLFFV